MTPTASGPDRVAPVVRLEDAREARAKRRAELIASSRHPSLLFTADSDGLRHRRVDGRTACGAGGTLRVSSASDTPCPVCLPSGAVAGAGR